MLLFLTLPPPPHGLITVKLYAGAGCHVAPCFLAKHRHLNAGCFGTPQLASAAENVRSGSPGPEPTKQAGFAGAYRGVAVFRIVPCWRIKCRTIGTEKQHSPSFRPAGCPGCRGPGEVTGATSFLCLECRVGKWRNTGEETNGSPKEAGWLRRLGLVFLPKAPSTELTGRAWWRHMRRRRRNSCCIFTGSSCGAASANLRLLPF